MFEECKNFTQAGFTIARLIRIALIVINAIFCSKGLVPEGEV